MDYITVGKRSINMLIVEVDLREAETSVKFVDFVF